nr:MAG TPA: hypothetical protein [Caudoviricetes sp.]
MLEDKKIEEAARRYSEVTDCDKEEALLIEEGFKEGAKWAINEFLKDLWHPNTEEPREFAEVLAEAKITESIKTYISFKRNDALFKNWDAYSSGANITRWLYIDDLLPKEGGKQ